ncbi:hypothetical protein DFQ28_001378 [Apophysomyces sp. BC1034]|nr:hypothetical protein DFQ28_001378 [Apophysomyces sp. BC1034]
MGSANPAGDLYFVQDLSAKTDRVQPRFQDLSYCHFNSHVKSVEFAPDYSAEAVHKAWQSIGRMFDQKPSPHTRFLTTAANGLYIWDVLQEKEPLVSLKEGESPVHCASWSPHDPATLIAFGNGNELHIMDTRTSGTVWSTKEAHALSVQDAKFNPFIPYWLASAGQDGMVNIWDIRSSYHAPVGKIDGHHSVVNQIAWSNMRPENLNTVSSDGTMKMWMLSTACIPVWDTFHDLMNQPKHTMFDDDDPDLPEVVGLVGAAGVGTWGRSDVAPVYVGEDVEPSKGSVVAIRPSKMRPGLYYCATSRGQLTSQMMRFNQRNRLDYHHQFDYEKDPLAYELEHNIYCRQIKIAHQNLEKLKEPVEDEEQNKQRQEQAAFLEECLKVPDPILDWQIDSLPDKKDRRVSRRLWNEDDLWEFAVNTFKKDLSYWCARIPPNMATRYNYQFDMTPVIRPAQSQEDDHEEGEEEEALAEKERTPSPIEPDEMANIRVSGDNPPVWTNPDVKHIPARPVSTASTGPERLRSSALKRVFSRRQQPPQQQQPEHQQQQPMKESREQEHTPPSLEQQRTDRRNAFHVPK